MLIFRVDSTAHLYPPLTMTNAKSFGLHLLVLFVFLQINHPAFSQPIISDYKGWSEKLSSTNDDNNDAYYTLIPILTHTDSATVFRFVRHLETVTADPNSYFKARFYCLTLNVRTLFQPESDHAELILLTRKALNEAFKTKDESLIAFTYFMCGTLMASIREMEHTVTYLINGQETYDRIGQKRREQYYDWILIGEVLFHCHDYEKSIYYTHKGIDIYDDTSARSDYFRARFYNTIGQNYEKLYQLDSALCYYKKSLQLSDKVNDPVWIGINNGFIGDVLFKTKQFDKALPHLQLNYAINKTREQVHAAKSLQYIARINLVNGKTDSALLNVKEALRLMEVAGAGYYLQQKNFLDLVYQATAEVYHAKGNIDSFYRYNQLYTTLHDSIENVATLSSMKITALRIENENSLRAIETLQKERRTEILKRNFAIIAIMLVSVILFMYVNRMRLRQSHKNQIAAAELKSAREQMEIFTANITEKSTLVEKLNHQLADKALSSEQSRLLDDIASHTILTEDDWNNFKRIFERVYPGFFVKLKQKAPDITVAEQRMAALTRLNITSRQMAAILGISVDSVHKTRQRLRQRLHIHGEGSLEEVVADL
jgi:tetratricopeptide (TPR) repeat protein/DNA-binding CsgD family transcriptional regulator